MKGKGKKKTSGKIIKEKTLELTFNRETTSVQRGGSNCKRKGRGAPALERKWGGSQKKDQDGLKSKLADFP